MKRLDIIVEGPSEREFVSQCLAPYLGYLGVINEYDVSPIVIRTNMNYRGGMTKYSQLRDDIHKSLASENSQLIVSMMVDFFRLSTNVPRPDNYDYLSSDYEKADAIQQCIADDLNDSRFIPYIQMHEFEAFLFADRKGFDYCYGTDNRRSMQLYNIIDQYPNPEDINSSPDGAPSKRMLSIIMEYEKVLDGNLIILQNGIDSILSKCPRFRAWVELLIQRCRE